MYSIMHMCVHIHVCMYMYMYVCISVHPLFIYECVFIHTYMYMQMHTVYIHTYVLNYQLPCVDIMNSSMLLLSFVYMTMAQVVECWRPKVRGPRFNPGWLLVFHKFSKICLKDFHMYNVAYMLCLVAP